MKNQDSNKIAKKIDPTHVIDQIDSDHDEIQERLRAERGKKSDRIAGGKLLYDRKKIFPASRPGKNVPNPS